jgi:hypothetical protein
MAQEKGAFRVYWQTHETNLQAQDKVSIDKVARQIRLHRLSAGRCMAPS